MTAREQLVEFIVGQLPPDIDARRALLVAAVEVMPREARLRQLLASLDTHLSNQRELALGGGRSARGSARLGERPIAR